MSEAKYKGLATRVISAVALLPLVLGADYLGDIWFSALLALAGVLLLVEWVRLIGLDGPMRLVVIGVGVLPAFGLFDPALKSQLFNYMITMAVVAILFRVFGRRTRKAEYGLAGLTFPYIWYAIYALAWIRLEWPYPATELNVPEGAVLVFWVLAAVWLTDIGGYFAGKSIGGPKLAPRISPNKTWAGLIGGVVLAAVAGLITAPFTQIYDYWDGALLSMALGAISQAGDLFESGIKRRFGVKDSGGIIPGHGGILDRVDGLLFAAPAAMIWLLVITQ